MKANPRARIFCMKHLPILPENLARPVPISELDACPDCRPLEPTMLAEAPITKEQAS